MVSAILNLDDIFVSDFFTTQAAEQIISNYQCLLTEVCLKTDTQENTSKLSEIATKIIRERAKI